MEAPRVTGRPPEEVLGQEALKLGLREAVMACLCGGESRRWTVGELRGRFKALGICASRAGVLAALAAPGTGDRMDPGSQSRGSGAALWGEKIAGSRT